ncbi:hypothetical protein EMCRGX_G030720 [Ephydatia muelleri]
MPNVDLSLSTQGLWIKIQLGNAKLFPLSVANKSHPVRSSIVRVWIGGGGGTAAEIWFDTLRWSSRRTSSIEKEAYYLSMNQQALSSSSNMRSASSLLPLKMELVNTALALTNTKL